MAQMNWQLLSISVRYASALRSMGLMTRRAGVACLATAMSHTQASRRGLLLITRHMQT